VTDNPFRPPASAAAPMTDPYAPLRDALAAWPRQAIPLALNMAGVNLVILVSVVLCFVPALFVVPLAGWTAGRVLIGTADGDPPIPWGRMTLRRLWPTGAALFLVGSALMLGALVPSVAVLLLPLRAAMMASVPANILTWPVFALLTFTVLRWADDDHEEVTAQRALTDASRLVLGHARTWTAIYAVTFCFNLPGIVFTAKRDHGGMLAQLLTGAPVPAREVHPIDLAISLVSLLVGLWSSLALARLYRVAHPAQPPTASTPTAAHP
jgi:hypothetical protein